MNNRFYSPFDYETDAGNGKRPDDFRSPFEVDRDRILHTSAFRRLQSKTQVFLSGEYDFYRTRLTHSLEVAQIGRAIAKYLQRHDAHLSADYFIDGDLVEAVCLSHDLGHPPFGHAGENTLNRVMSDYGGFEGNAQTLRLMTDTIYGHKRGMQPTRAFMDGVLKYKSLYTEMRSLNGGKPPKNHFLYDHQCDKLDFVFGGRDFPVELTPGKMRNGFKSIECQIMDWADDTAYSLNDIVDSIQAGFLNGDRIRAWAEASALDEAQSAHVDGLLKAISDGKVEGAMGRKIGQFVQATRLEEDVNFMSGETNRYRYRLVIDPAVVAESALYKKLAYELVFTSHQLKQLEFKGDRMLVSLFEAFVGEYVEEEKPSFQLLPPEIAALVSVQETKPAKVRVICDFLASMTDSAAARTYRRLHDPTFGSIVDLV
ncbi:dGTP triphosphohydrolase [Sulfuriroseicoccus oceanibius]|uniref:DNTP triphosphohydrolase n=1 Tax=Sulfuriroseicoccus oceanibius TaxID=2707525 RepID=A0A6B3L813_9BACT|nr:dNTP triphosphohydrolase [Sulfuriroseicoccus oceanibius]QQL44822.1 dNTP triphosphohydrolase [Sulfuriroseicoccus oceanibius]